LRHPLALPTIGPMTAEEQAELVSDLLEPIPRTAVVPAVRAALGLSEKQADRIVQAFDDFVAKPLAANLAKLRGRDLAKRNPLIYTVRGVETVEEWATQVLADKEASAIEAHIGTWLEEVARIVGGGIKPGSGVDLQLQGADGVVQLYAIQAHRTRRTLGAQERHRGVTSRRATASRAPAAGRAYVAVLGGRAKTAVVRMHPDVTALSSDDFWERVTGISDFRARLVRASTILGWLVKRRSEDEAARIKNEALELFGDADGKLDL